MYLITNICITNICKYVCVDKCDCVYNMYPHVYIAYRSAGTKHDLLLRGARSSRVKDKARAEEVAMLCYVFLTFHTMYLD